MTKYHLIIVFKSFDKPLHLYFPSRTDSLSSHYHMSEVFGSDIIRAELRTGYYRDHGDSHFTLIKEEREVLK